jgi:DNA polymerase-3 subunit alpha
MKYFCNTRLEHLKDLNNFLGKNISIGGIVTKVEHRTAKNGNGWGMFTLEGYDETFEFRVFGEEYLKFRHLLVQNSFTFIKLIVKEGWVNKEGKKGDPRMQFTEVKMLTDVLNTYAKKLVLQLSINDLSEKMIQSLRELFEKEKGDNQITIEVMELEKIKRQIIETIENEAIDVSDESETDEELMTVEIAPRVTEVEEIKVVTKLSMPSRKMKVKISNELLQELESMQINFKLN